MQRARDRAEREKRERLAAAYELAKLQAANRAARSVLKGPAGSSETSS